VRHLSLCVSGTKQPSDAAGGSSGGGDLERTQQWDRWTGTRYASGVDGGHESPPHPESDASRRPGINLVSRSTGRKGGIDDRMMLIMGWEGLCNQKRAKPKMRARGCVRTKRTYEQENQANGWIKDGNGQVQWRSSEVDGMEAERNEH
jgi:hypothetical protein